MSRRYMRLVSGRNDRTIGVIRLRIEDGDARVEVWRHGEWAFEPGYASHFILGELGAEDCTEDEALAIVDQLERGRAH